MNNNAWANPLKPIPSYYPIAGNIHAVNNFVFFVDWQICAQIKTTNN